MTGRGFRPGQSGNPGGRSQGLARATRELVGEDGMALAQPWWSIAQDETRPDTDRLEASRLLADRGWGKAAAYQPQEGDPLDLASMEQAAEEFRAKILRLAEGPDSAEPCPKLSALRLCRDVRALHRPSEPTEL